MKHWLIIIFSAILVSAFIACGSPSKPGQPASPNNPQITQGASLKQTWVIEWDKTVAAAKKEGKVVIAGPPGDDVRRYLVGEFSKDYPGIEVDWNGIGGSEFIPKLKAERRAGLFTTDLHMGGTTSIISNMKDISQPVEPLLILPEVKDGKYWQDGKLDYADSEGKFNLMFVAYARLAAIYNPQLLDSKKAKELSFLELTKPEFKGKIIMADPRIAGPGQSFALFLYLHPQLGKDYFKAFAKNDVLLSRDLRQLIEWVSTGKYTVGLAVDELTLASLRKAGIQNIQNQPRLKEGTYVTAGFGSLVVPDTVPHPNASKIYLNWLLSKKGQAAWVAGAGTPTRRLDVPLNSLDPDYFIEPGITYVNSSKENVVKYRGELRDFLLEILGN